MTKQEIIADIKENWNLDPIKPAPWENSHTEFVFEIEESEFITIELYYYQQPNGDWKGPDIDVFYPDENPDLEDGCSLELKELGFSPTFAEGVAAARAGLRSREGDPDHG